MLPPHLNETFVRFVQLVQTDDDMAEFVRSLAEADATHRAMLLTQTAARMRAEKQPEELVQVVEWLREPAVLGKLLELIESE